MSPEDAQRLREMRAYSEEHRLARPEVLYWVRRSAELGTAGILALRAAGAPDEDLPPAVRPGHSYRMQGLQIVFTISELGGSWYRQLSVSADGANVRPDVVAPIARELGYEDFGTRVRTGHVHAVQSPGGIVNYFEAMGGPA